MHTSTINTDERKPCEISKIFQTETY